MKIAFSGTHGTGKTTRTLMKAVELKKEYPSKMVRMLYEVASDCPFGTNHDADESSQMWIFSSQIKYEIENGANSDILICDRTIVDCLAYTIYFGFTHLADSMREIALYWAGTYQQIYLLEPDANNRCFADGVRVAVNDEYCKSVHKILKSLYAELQIPIVIL